jgi:PAS domain S-box-containing protein
MAASATSGPINYEQAVSLLMSLVGSGAASASSAPSPIAPRTDSSAQESQPVEARSGAWKAERRYRALIEQIPVVTFMAALDETVHELYVSPQIETLLGFSQAEWLDDPFLWYNRLHPDDRERWQNEFARTCATGVQFRSEYRLIARDGRVVWVHGECQIIRDEAGQPSFLQGVAYDISETKRAEEALQRLHGDLELIVQQRTAELAKANAELIRSNTDLSQFAYVASHDLQEPLRMMASFAQLLAERYQGKLDADADEFIHFITDGAGRMQRLINDLLLYSRVGKGEIAMAPVNCDTVVAMACQNLQTAITQSKGSVSADKLPMVLGNDAQLVQLLQNLVGNAIKFARQDVTPEVRIGAKKQADEWLFWVRDNGIGFDPNHAERIFLIFQRLRPRVEYAGTGIGLAICRKIVERHGGRIWAESAPDKGSTFYFTLPAKEVSNEQLDEG